MLQKNLKLAVEFDEQIPSSLIGQRLNVYRILLNLISNAIKFTEQGGIKISLRLIRQTSTEAFIKMSVQDTGIGISKDKLEIIFERFTRLNPAYEGIYKGSGLGLSIVKKFIKEMQGEISVESEEGKGSTFICIFPLKKIQKFEDKAPNNEELLNVNEVEFFTGKNDKTNLTTTSFAAKKPIELHSLLRNQYNILLIEDNLIAANAIKDTLESLKCEVNIAYTGCAAVEVFMPETYDLIYLDLGLPDIDGLSIIKILRKIEAYAKQKTTILALSAHIDENIKLSCLHSGFDGVYSKPLLRHQVEQHLLLYGKM